MYTYQFYEKKKDYMEALKYHILYNEIKDSIYTETSSEQMAEMRTQYETEKKEAEIHQLTLTAFDSLGATVNVVNSQALGDNSFQRMSVNRSPIARLFFELPGSGSLSDFTICFPPAAIGNRVWVDENSDGLQDEGEPGLANVAVELWQDTD